MSPKHEKIDSRFVYSEVPKWRQGQKQFLWGSEIITIPPTSKSATSYEFDLPTGSTLLFGTQSGFYVKGVFEYKPAPTTPPAGQVAVEPVFTTIAASHGETVALIPNWFEHLLKETQVYHNNMPLNPHDVPRYSDAFLNSYLYANMYEETKNCMFPELLSPGRCVGHVDTDFALTDEKNIWRKYANEAFGTRKVEFRYIPCNVFPFMQQTNFCTDGRPPAAIPMPVLQKMTVSLQFKEKQDFIFIKASTNTNTYRFRIESIELVVEEAKINPSMEKSFLNQRGQLQFSGVTKFAMTENVNTGSQLHRIRFQDVPMPEGIFIFALPKTALSGNYAPATPTGQVFEKHNIKRVEVFFENMPLAIKTPSYGDLHQHPVEIKQMMDHFEHPPFGMLQDPAKAVLKNIVEGGEKTAYPHVYINLCPSGKETRLIPVGADGSIINKNGDLDLSLHFGSTGAKDVTYLAYIFYTDINMTLDMNSHTFSSMYKRARAN